MHHGVVPGLFGLEVAVVVGPAEARAAGALVVVGAGDDGRAVGAGVAAVEGPRDAREGRGLFLVFFASPPGPLVFE